MHAVIVRPLGRQLSPAPPVTDDPVAAFRAARADIEAMLDEPAVAATECETPMGTMTIEDHVDQVPSADLVVHGWDLARATGQDDTIDTDEVAQMWPGAQHIGEEMRTPGFFGPGIVVFGPEVPVPVDAPLQDRLLGLLGPRPDVGGARLIVVTPGRIVCRLGVPADVPWRHGRHHRRGRAGGAAATASCAC